MTAKLLPILCILLSTFFSILNAEEVYLSSNDFSATSCSGVWSKEAILGGSQPYIKGISIGHESKGKVSMLIYEWQDFEKLGIYDEQAKETVYVCDQLAVSHKLCKSSEIGQFITNIPSDQANSTSILTSTINMTGNQTEMALYKVDYTGYYCVALVPAGGQNETYFEAWVEWRFPYGELPATDYPKLLLYGALACVYLAVGIFWAIQSYRNWSDILPVQHFLSATIFYLIVEMAFNFGFWEAYNQTGQTSLLNAGRTSMSFFMLLIVCMGYSVVKPSLGSAMKKCIILACTHFFFGVIYTLGTMLLTPETAGLLILLVIFPLSITMTIFYVWTLNSITSTIHDLELRKQHVKVLMYKRLYRLLLFSVIAVVTIFILNMFAFSGRMAIDWAAKNWKFRWVMLDGLLNVLYFIVFFVIVVLWRPTSNNARYGLMQISQDEEEALDLEERLRRAEHPENPNRGRNIQDDAAVFELGGELTDEEEDHPPIHKNVELSDLKNKSGYHRPGRGGEQSALLHVDQEEEDDDDQ
ncbi:lung seven transmembrane receptor-domain-containing protein [Gilbertella persicaria]|uniref:lung seven transmembrane receptor-domain-containing protein n=1 Tax=Gilbertella persicaria TaxID=101096 RepID=UPI00221ED2C8|nr:lung seven transmembrane receptor-domain-containing protein [Gilbertella persicaria]KAI8065346.1 lung seven transmembrane receptor-domain-containing protein [Gilbertella persicaria]